MKPERLVSRLMVIAFLASLPVTTGACGFILTHAPPEGHEQMDYFTCTESDAGPIIDFVWAGLNVAGAIVYASDPDAYENSSAGIAVGLGWGAFSTSAGIVGLNKTKKCRAAKRQLAERQARGRAAERDQPADILVQTVVLMPAVDTLNNAGLVTAHATGAVIIAARTDNVVGTGNIVVVSPR